MTIGFMDEGVSATETLDRLKGYLEKETWNEVLKRIESMREIRLRTGRPVQIIGEGFNILIEEAITQEKMRSILAALMDYSVYSREEEIKQCFFTMRDGCRVGICGKALIKDGEIAGINHIGSICVRIAREIPGSSRELYKLIRTENGLKSLLVVSPPGYGKTTCLRDLARLLSENGFCVAIADERHEIAACVQGAPSLDVGMRSDIMDGCPKWIAIERMIRSMAPDIIITDEIGSKKDAEVLSDAMRCGVKVVASAHADSFESLKKRENIAFMLREGVFSEAVVFGGTPGKIIERISFEKEQEEE